MPVSAGLLVFPLVTFALVAALALRFLTDLASITPSILRADYLAILSRLHDLVSSRDYFGLYRLVAENQSGHIFVPYKLYAVFNYFAFGWSTGVSKAAMLACILFVGATVAAIAAVRLRRSPVISLLAAASAAAIIFNFNGYDAQVWTDGGIVLYPPVGLSLIALFLLDNGMRTSGQWRRSMLVWGTLLGGMNTLSNGSGIAIVPATAALFLLHGLNDIANWRARAKTGTLVIAGLLAPTFVLSAIGGFARVNSDTTASLLSASLERPGQLAEALLALLIWPLYQGETRTAAAWGAAALLLFALLFLLALLRRLPMASYLWLSYAVYGICCAAAVALARTYYFFDILKFIPSNYAIYSMPFVLGGSVLLFSLADSFAGLHGGEGVPRSSLRIVATASIAAALAIAVIWVASDISRTDRPKAVALGVETGDAYTLAGNWNLFSSYRISGGDPNLAVAFLRHTFADWKKHRMVRSLTNDFVPYNGSFMGKRNVYQISPLVVPEADAACEGLYGAPSVMRAAKETRLEIEQRAPDMPFANFAGRVLSPSDCTKPVDRIFLTEPDGRLICASKPHPRLYDMPDRPRDVLLGNPNAFEFSCPMTEEMLKSRKWRVFGWVRQPGAIVEVPLSEAAGL